MAAQNQPTQNVMHQGAHHLLHEPSTGGSPHKEGGKSDGQTRTMVGGARKEMVDKMIAGGHAKEEDRAHLEGMPDDHFQAIQKWATRGATQAITPYTYEGIGDRSNVHGTHNSQVQPMTYNQWYEAAPPDGRELLDYGRQQIAEKRASLVSIIVNSPGNRSAAQPLNPDWLMKRPMTELEVMARLAGGAAAQRPAGPVHNYGGQAEVPMYLPPRTPDQTQNAAAEEDEQVLGFPSTAPEPKAAVS